MNDHLADALDAFTTICITAIEKAKQWHEIADERSTEIIRLNARVAELEQVLADSVNADWHNKRVAELEKTHQPAIGIMYELPSRIIAMCKARGWSMHWTHRGAYLHLEASELIEAIRGKHGDPTEEAGDVLLVLMSITEYAGIPFWRVVDKAITKLTHLENAPHYPGEEYKLDTSDDKGD